MLRRADSPYRPGRSDDLIKLKLFEDAEAVVVAHLPGKGKYQGLTGALLVEMPNGQRFKIGSGLRDVDRASRRPLAAPSPTASTAPTPAGCHALPATGACGTLGEIKNHSVYRLYLLVF